MIEIKIQFKGDDAEEAREAFWDWWNARPNLPEWGFWGACRDHDLEPDDWEVNAIYETITMET